MTERPSSRNLITNTNNATIGKFRDDGSSVQETLLLIENGFPEGNQD